VIVLWLCCDCALIGDANMDRFAFKMGIPVFLYRSSVGHSGDMSYGSQAFKKVTKLKSKVVYGSWVQTFEILFPVGLASFLIGIVSAAAAPSFF